MPLQQKILNLKSHFLQDFEKKSGGGGLCGRGSEGGKEGHITGIRVFRSLVLLHYTIKPADANGMIANDKPGQHNIAPPCLKSEKSHQ